MIAPLNLNDQMMNISCPITILTNETYTHEGINQLTARRAFLRETYFGQELRALYPSSLMINVPAGPQ